MLHEILFVLASTSTTIPSAPVSSSHPDAWIVIAAVVASAVATISLIYTIIQGRLTKKNKKKTDDQKEVDTETKVTGEYLRRSLDAFDDLVGSLQAEVGRMTTERNEARKIAEDIERKLTKEIDALRREVRSLRKVLQAHGIPIPIDVS